MMKVERDATSLRARLGDPAILVAPGIYDPLSGLLAEQAGFECAYVSGASIAYTRHGRSDIGLVGMTEVAETIGLIRDRISLHLVVDGDTGYGNAMNVQRTVRLFERSGANAIQLEDQTFPKRCGHLKDKTVIPANEMVGKLKAAVDARGSNEFLIIARTDAAAVEGLESAIERAAAYADAGADVLFVEAPRSREELRQVHTALGSLGLPLMANMVEGGKTPVLSGAQLSELGFSLVIFPGGAVRAIAHTAQRYYASLAEHGTTAPFASEMFDFDGLNAVIGTPEILELSARYEGS
ncbi:MAG: oxaloacetate decarboxylase [Burkholderiaceae bacterium]